MDRTSLRRIFLDHASTTPVAPEVEEAMRPFFASDFANPSALYAEGVRAKEAMRTARETIARVLQCRPYEIVFTGSGTESDNLAILGALRKHWNAGFNHMVTTSIEHPAVMEAARAVESDGGAVKHVPAGESGIVKSADIMRAITEKTAVVSVMMANNEVGTIQPVVAIGKLIREYRTKHKTDLPYFHVDASQAANYLDISVSRLGADLLTLDGSKIYGPKGVGMLFVRKGVELSPLYFGGGQERGLRPGTENIPGIIGFAKALELASSLRGAETKRLSALRDRLIEKVLEGVPSASLNGDPKERLPNNANICFPGIDAEFAVIKLDAEGVAVSAASSCRTISDETYSYVIEVIGRPECASSSLRFTLGRGTTQEEVDRAVEMVINTLK